MAFIALYYDGQYYDGQSAEAQPVRLMLEPGSLVIEGIARWPLSQVALISEPRQHAPLVLGLGAMHDARLECHDPALLAAMTQAGGTPQRRLRSLAPALRALVFIACLLAVLAFGFSRLAGPMAQLIPHEAEQAFGARMTDQVQYLFAIDERDIRHCVAPDGLAALAKMIATLEAQDGASYAYQVRVLKTDMPNAVALPGGHIIILSGILDFLESPDELSGILAHEMGHVLHRHGTEGLIRAVGTSGLVSIAMGDVSGTVPAMAMEQAVNSVNSRRFEREADESGVAMLEAAGVEAKGLSRFFARLADEDGAAILPDWLSTHPSSQARAAYLERAASGPSILTPAEWQALQDVCKVTELQAQNDLADWLEQVRILRQRWFGDADE